MSSWPRLAVPLRRSSATLIAAVALVVAPGPVWAQATSGDAPAPPPSALAAGDAARADALFDQGRALMMGGTLAEACATLQESHRLHDRGDTLLNLAECHRRQGKTATAWGEFDRAIEHADRAKYEDAIVVAQVRRDELAALLSTLTVRVPDEVAALPDLVVEVNGAPLPQERWNRASTLDPGSFEVVARASGHRPFTRRIELGAQKDAQSVVVALEKEAPPPPRATAPPPPPMPGEPLPVWPFAVGGVGVALVGVAAAFGVDALNAGAELDAACGDARGRCPGPRRGELESTRDREIASFGAFVGLGSAGLIAVGVAGVALGLAVGGGSTTTTAITVGPGSLDVRGSFK